MFKRKNIFEGNILQNIIDEVKDIEKIQLETKFNVANALDSLLKNKGISKSEFAAKLGKSPSEISKWMSGKHNFTLDTLLEIAHALKVDITELIKHKPEPLIKSEWKVTRKSDNESNSESSEKKDEKGNYDSFEYLD